MTLFGKNATFDKLLDKATSHLLLEPDWGSNMNVCDMVRQGEVSAKYAIGAVKKKLGHSNPHVVIYSLHLVEAMAKNCGSPVHEEIATQDFMNQMKNLVKEKDPVKAKVLELIQLWAHAFRHQSKYVAIQSTFKALQSAGNSFPTLIESDAMFASENAPEWQDSDVCLHCKTAFTTLKRKVSLIDKLMKSANVKHHCRNCGNIFCDECSSKRSNIPKYGIEKDVRVCDSCYDQIKGSTISRPSIKKGGHVQFNDDVAVRNFQPESKDSSDSEALRVQKEKELELQEKEELELALALSASEAESHEIKKGKSTQKPVTSQPTVNSQPECNSLYSSLDTSEMDPELARYLNRNYWENKAFESSGIKSAQPSAPTMPNSPNKLSQSNYVESAVVSNSQTKSKLPSESSMKESGISADQEEFLSALKSSIEIFVNRMHSNQQRGRSIAHDSAVQTLFLTLNAMHPQLLQYINEKDDRRSYFETLQDKLAQLRESREALDALREEHRDKRRREEEEAARLRQIQMMQKLEIMRQKKQEFLDYQRQLAVDRMQQQEREMAARLAQQKQMMQMRQYQQQYPYSMQHPINAAPDSFPVANSQQQGIAQYNQPQMVVQQQQQHTGAVSLPQGVPMDSYGYPIVNQYPNVPPPTAADYYNMQNMNQAMLGTVRPPEGAAINQMGYMIPPQSTQQPLANNMYAMQVPPQPMPAWPEQNNLVAPPPGAVNGVSQSNPPIQEKKEDQLISFD